MAEIGAVINKAYRITERIDRSATSNFYLAEDVKTGKRCAVKEIRKTDDKANQLYISGLIQEAKSIKENSSPAFPRIIDVCEEKDAIYIVREYIEGKTLEELVQKEGPQPEDKVMGWALELCDALAYLHNLPLPIVYRSLKPSKIIINSDGRLMMLNYDMARDMDPVQANRAVAADKNGFMAPEQIFGQSDERSDIYALGATLRYLLTGIDPTAEKDVPYDGIYAEKKISPKMISLIDRCTAYYPDERFQSCEEMRAAITGERVSRIEDDMPEDRRTSRIIIRTVIALIVVVIAVVAFFAFGNSSNKAPQTSDATYTQLTTVPKVAGKTYEEAKQLLIIAGLQYEKTEAYSAKVKRGVVISQNIKPNQALEKGGVVKLKVSLGPKPTEPPAPSETEPEPTAEARSSNNNHNNNYGSSSTYNDNDNSSGNSDTSDSQPEDSDSADSAAPDDSNNTPADNGGNNTPADNGGNNTPADNGGNNTPADNGGNNTPADNGGNNTPADNANDSAESSPEA